MPVSPIPDGYPRLSVGLAVDGASAAIEFYEKIFGATCRMRMETPDGAIAHAELELGDSLIMIGDAQPEMEFLSPKSIGGTPVWLSVYVDDVDKTFAEAIEAGSIELDPVVDRFYGDRGGRLEDPWGHRWHISTHIEDVDPEELERRAAAEMGG